ncbi:probable LRR receptor-like serine/threonine-protein kinase At1g67720 isoform X1 [Typha latifolia]|uniref:probable LRR receptor-like serine/threonine-protein kinase At1g67720 isoform X1 n=1 Tax=Typha latifolia TaxID=4733 RepID=UPI003C2E2144
MATPLRLLLLRFVVFSFFCVSQLDAQVPGFVSLDCGGAEKYIDDIGLEWIPDFQFPFGETTNISVPNENRRQFMTVRYFPADDRKYCYTFNVTTRTRYLVRASFLYGNFDESNVFPEFDIFIGASHWSTIVIYDESTIITKELILLASSPTISVCLSNATTGQPFISTLELRQFNNSLYYTEHETEFFLSLSARINFGAQSDDPVRYPDDPFDRIWESDSLKRANYLVDVAPGTTNVSTSMPVTVASDEKPPEKVMQTAVVGQNGTLTYRLNLGGFPGYGWAFSYFAEIEDLGPTETRKFKLFIPGNTDVSKPTVDIQENAPGKYRLYEPGYYNISLPFVFSFAFEKTNDSSRGPILNALEIYKYLPINYGSQDASAMATFASHYAFADWAQEGSDPCLPAPWSWVQCNSDPQPRVVSIILSHKNLTGNIPLELTKLSGLTELWLDGNGLSGQIPDLSACSSLKYIHFENNQLTGALPSSLVDLPSLSELYVQNNLLSGILPKGLLNKNITVNFTGNIYLRKESNARSHMIIVICSVLGAVLLLAAILSFYLLARKKMKFSDEDNLTGVLPPQKLCSSSYSELATETTAHRYTLSELEEATTKFAKRIGSGGFGIVYYGRMKDGKEIAVKVHIYDSYQGNKQFSNEVSLLSRIHHRNLVAFLGYCQQEEKNILVYEFMHNGSLKEHLHARESHLSWIKRLEIAEDSAKGIEYLHSGCTPSIIHRDLKTSNILLDKNMRAKVSDFGLSKPAAEESHVSSVVRGTLGYLDPEYYTSQQLTEKSDVYSFGIILLELISGLEPISNTSFGENFRNIGPWARFHYQSGNIKGIIDPALQDGYNDIQSVWKIAEIAMRCLNRMQNRPAMSQVIKEIQDAIALEQAPMNEGTKFSFSPSVRMDATNVDNCTQESSTNSLEQPELR